MPSEKPSYMPAESGTQPLLTKQRFFETKKFYQADVNPPI